MYKGICQTNCINTHGTDNAAKYNYPANFPANIFQNCSVY